MTNQYHDLMSQKLAPHKASNRLYRKQSATIAEEALAARMLVQEIGPRVRGENAKTQKLAPNGIKEEIRKGLAEHLDSLARSFHKLEQIEAQVAATRPTLPPHPANDIDGAMIRVQARQWFASQPSEFRSLAVRDDSKMSASMRRAIVDAPAELSGITAAEREMLRAKELRAVAPDKMAAFDGDMEAIELAKTVHLTALQTLRQSGEFGDGPSGEMAYNKFERETLKPFRDELAAASKK